MLDSQSKYMWNGYDLHQVENLDLNTSCTCSNIVKVLLAAVIITLILKLYDA